MSQQLNSPIGRNGLSPEGEKEAFKTLNKASEHSADVDSSAIDRVQKTHSDYNSLLGDGLKSSSSEKEKVYFTDKAEEAFKKATDDIREINYRSHKTQRGIATIAAKVLLAGAAAAAAGGIWLLARSR